MSNVALMRFTARTIACAAIVAFAACGGGVAADSRQTSDSSTTQEADSAGAKRESAAVKVDGNIPLGAAVLLRCYPSFVKEYRDGKLEMADGSTIVYNDGREKSFVEKLDAADPEDMFAFDYNMTASTPEYLQDAGRSRCEALFKKMYGSSAAAVQKHLVSVNWFGQRLQFTNVNGAADSLRAVAAELARHPNLKKHLRSSGTFYWRKVRGAQRQSAHSYGMTIDIGVTNGGGGGDYWQWKNPGKSETAKITYSNHMPLEVVEIFERHGFIWGGRWYHYDTMHFEYRPEILMYEKLKNQQ
ncbi:MAG: M15 family metallopeptidase [Muribaculaceae bacterium]|nr:M15 family metallopeptidase [Muribaculaceae bacterium]